MSEKETKKERRKQTFELDQNLGANILEELFNVVTNERVIHDGSSVV